MFVWRAAAAAAGLSRSGSHQGCPVCFLPRVIYSCGGGLHVGSINAQRFFTKGGKIKKIQLFICLRNISVKISNRTTAAQSTAEDVADNIL